MQIKGKHVAVACLVVTLFSFYIQLRALQDRGQDYMPIVLNLIVTCLLWAGLIWAFVLYRRDARSAETRLANEMYEHGVQMRSLKDGYENKLHNLRGENKTLLEAIAAKREEIQEARSQYYAAIEKWKTSSVCRVLADEAGELLQKLKGIHSDATALGQEDAEAILALKRPLGDIPWPWHSRALIEFQYGYSVHRARAIAFQKTSSGITRYAIPTDSKNCEETLDMLLNHQKQLLSQVED
jgi:hypothetical protein